MLRASYRLLRAFLVAVACPTLLGGCSYSLPALKPPKFDPDTASVAAMEQYDTNADGEIDKTELKSAPGLNYALESIDENGDKAITPDEISQMIEDKWLNQTAGVMRVSVEVYLNRKPLYGATVLFEPEEFLGDVIYPATGETGDDGFGSVSIASENMPHENVRSGVLPGLYKVRISKEVNGKELVPKKYNTETTLGIEVAARAPYMPGPARFDLKK